MFSWRKCWNHCCNWLWCVFLIIIFILFMV
jgi:hypothetical protein